MMKVLIIEDKVERIRLLAEIYSAHEISVAENIEAAQDQLFSSDFDLIHLDYDLDDRNTEEIVHLISEKTVVVIHSENPDGVKVLQSKIPGSFAIPFHLLIEKSDYSSRLKSMMANSNMQNLRVFLNSGKRGAWLKNPSGQIEICTTNGSWSFATKLR